jgi:acyl-coenzyme A thioesterase PaaI-like protein
MSKVYDNCFVCGKANPIGLKIDFFYDEAGAVAAEVCLSELFEGYPGVIHGGMLSTLLDEVMAKAVLHKGKTAVTAKLCVSFRKALPPQHKILLKGWIVQAKTRTIATAAKLYDHNAIYAEAEAVFVVPREAL